MVPLTQELTLDMPRNATVATFREWLQKRHYPELLEGLQSLKNEIAASETMLSGGVPLLNNLKQELDIIHEKEQETILPALSLLEQQGRKTECKLFKITDVNYIAVELFIQQLKLLAGTQQASGKLEAMEHAIIESKHAKGKHLFNRFKHCSGGCKVYEQK